MDTVRIRDAGAADAADIARIYNHYILETTATFDTDAKTDDERKAWLATHDAAHPVLVAETGGGVRAWGSLTKWAERPAWRHTVEVSVYVDLDARGRGLGGGLMTALLERARDVGHHTVIGQISAGNDASLELARRLGFEEAGRLHEVGRKFDQWLDVVLMEKHLEGPSRTEEDDDVL